MITGVILLIAGYFALPFPDYRYVGFLVGALCSTGFIVVILGCYFS
jgi:hypothetical protein